MAGHLRRHQRRRLLLDSRRPDPALQPGPGRAAGPAADGLLGRHLRERAALKRSAPPAAALADRRAPAEPSQEVALGNRWFRPSTDPMREAGG